jgi:hypothetical protein
MRVIGGTRAEAEAVLCRLVVDHEGEIEVSDEGAVVYRFKSLRRTAQAQAEVVASPIWTDHLPAPRLTGNGTGTNVFLGIINGFNLTMGGVALANGLTIERVVQILGQMGSEVATAAPPVTGFPVLLGAVPFGFSAALFALPAARLAFPGRKLRAVACENGRRGLLAGVVRGPAPEVVSAGDLRHAWRLSGGPAVSDSELTAEVRRLGGEPDVDEAGNLVYRFGDLHREGRALEADRKAAPASERLVGQVLFSSRGAPDES